MVHRMDPVLLPSMKADKCCIFPGHMQCSCKIHNRRNTGDPLDLIGFLTAFQHFLQLFRPTVKSCVPGKYDPDLLKFGMLPKIGFYFLGQIFGITNCRNLCHSFQKTPGSYDTVTSGKTRCCLRCHAFTSSHSDPDQIDRSFLFIHLCIPLASPCNH